MSIANIVQYHQMQRLHGFLPPVDQNRHVLAATARGDARRLLLSAARLDWRAISNCVGTQQGEVMFTCICLDTIALARALQV
jgi:hypothetical protein